MDYEGQRFSYILLRIILLVFSLAAFTAGTITNNVYSCFIVYGVGFLVASIVYIPDWPMYNQHPVSWRKGKIGGEGTLTKEQTKAKAASLAKQKRK